jgi:hypothetical protein
MEDYIFLLENTLIDKLTKLVLQHEYNYGFKFDTTSDPITKLYHHAKHIILNDLFTTDRSILINSIPKELGKSMIFNIQGGYSDRNKHSCTVAFIVEFRKVIQETIDFLSLQSTLDLNGKDYELN